MSTLYREIDALGGEDKSEWGRGFSDCLSYVLEILEKRGFSEHMDAAALGYVMAEDMVDITTKEYGQGYFCTPDAIRFDAQVQP